MTQLVDRVPAPGKKTPPILLVTGDADQTVYPRNPQALAETLRKSDHDVEERYYSGVDHTGILLALWWFFVAVMLCVLAPGAAYFSQVLLRKDERRSNTQLRVSVRA